MSRFHARSASDRTEAWPYWFVADRQKGDLNVTADLVRQLVDPSHRGGVFLCRDEAVEIAERANCIPGTTLPTSV